ncbi:hypothetical protein A1O3_09067 [Capronia epimyces CBS 606.96]|uniref:PSP1 C-terminal domain-containing protein n=1 Tax=Capronia epimyces CBS 606.96 TaxID=1182542 RepID=W9XCI4_9EURO|nr:uncharacterized protein A1O3_09067 [Capronia epimyces CBS 606.96]EXJ77908.1 hypothetical protein A1O3_09067 [Capronia epimyces CBS 606.96]
MSNPSSKQGGRASRGPMPAFGTFGAHQAPASILLEKSNPGLRRSTPDSEALASSDDEVEHPKGMASGNAKANRNARRTSWLNDVTSSNINRKPSITGPYSPSTSHPGTPGSEQAPWTNVNPSGAAGWSSQQTSYPWTNIWGQDGRKEPPARLQEVLPTNGDGGIPFSIPLQPTPKTYRSQSYSVGQLDTTSAPTAPNPVSTSVEATRNRLGGQYPSLQRRTSRTSGLGTIEPGGLGRLREIEDDEDDLEGNQMSEVIATEQARTIERLEKENAQLRQAAQTRGRALSGASAAPPPAPGFRNSRLRSAVPEEAETAIDDREDFAILGGLGDRENSTRRLSEQTLGYPERQPLSAIENRSLESVRKAQWQTSLGFGPIPEAPQSRRHSFADVPTRHGSFSSNGKDIDRIPWPALGTDLLEREDQMTAYESGSQTLSQGDDRELALALLQPNEIQMNIIYLRNRRAAAAYFNTTESTRRAADARVHQSHRDPQNYGPLGIGAFLEPVSQPLYIVNFKCCRSDVFYIQEGTGLHVNVGDLVIVEADRGTDLGTVQHTNVSWEDARRYKEYYAEEHYKWLMMFSMQSRNGGPNVVNPNGMSGRPGSAVGGMGPQGHHGPHDAPHSDLKPKMIKRLAQNHEIQSLKDKEGNEAKAKRVCQQKVIEHRLNMEILDAEFQMDSKKLTFYYFADNYINFNHLVTDLFKIYKTRIWMSAINPASFQTPTASLGITPVYSAAPGDERQRRRPQPVQQQAQQPLGLGSQPVTTPFGDSFDADRTFKNQAQGMRNSYYNQFQDVGAAGTGPQQLQPGVSPFSPNMPGPMDPFMSFYSPSYPSLNPGAPNFASNRPEFRGRGHNQPGDLNWMGRFQGLSLGS